MDNINILLAEDHNIVRNGIRSLLEKQDGFTIIGEAINGEEVLRLIGDGLVPDILLTDVNMPGINGLELTLQVTTVLPTCRIIVLSMLDHERYLFKAFKCGVSGYILKNIDADELIFAIRKVSRGGEYICTELSMRLLNKAMQAPERSEPKEHTDLHFTDKELEVLNLLAVGFTNQEVADKLFVSRRTVEGYRQSLLNKTGLRNTVSLIGFAIRAGIVN